MNIKSELKVDLIILPAENDYPSVDRAEVYKEILQQTENFKNKLGGKVHGKENHVANGEQLIISWPLLETLMAEEQNL